MKVWRPFSVKGFHSKNISFMKFKHLPVGKEHNTFTFSLSLKYSQSFLV